MYAHRVRLYPCKSSPTSQVQIHSCADVQVRLHSNVTVMSKEGLHPEYFDEAKVSCMFSRTRQVQHHPTLQPTVARRYTVMEKRC